MFQSANRKMISRKFAFFFFCQFVLWSETDYAMIFFLLCAFWCGVYYALFAFGELLIYRSIWRKQRKEFLACHYTYVVPCRVVWRLRLSSHVQFKVAGVRFFLSYHKCYLLRFFLFALVAADFRFQRRRNRRSRTVTRNRFSRPCIFRSFLNLRYFS